MTRFIEIYCSESCIKKTSDTKDNPNQILCLGFLIVLYHMNIIVCVPLALVLSLEICQVVFKTDWSVVIELPFSYFFHNS